MHNGDVYEASIKDIDKKSDIATIKINPQVRLQHARLGFLGTGSAVRLCTYETVHVYFKNDLRQKKLIMYQMMCYNSCIV